MTDCPYLLSCTETRKETCYKTYSDCRFYTIRKTIDELQQRAKDLSSKLKNRLGNPNDRNWGQF